MSRLVKAVNSPVPSAVWGAAALLAVALIPLAFGLEVPLTQKRSLTITPFEPVIWIVALWLLLSWVKAGELRKRLKGFLLAAAPALLLLAAALLSARAANFSYDNAKSLFVKSLIQWMEYLIFGVMVFHTLLCDPTWRRRAVAVFCWSGIFTVASVVVMAEGYGKTGYFQGGWLLNRHTYGIFLGLWLPVLLAASNLFSRRKMLLGITAALALAAGMYFSTSGGPFLGACLGLAIVLLGSRMAGNRYAWLAVSLIAILAIGGVLYSAPRRNALIDSVQVYVPFKDPDTGLTTREHTMRYYRWSANLEMVTDHPLSGVGLGQYGRRIDEYYAGINLPAGRTDRPELFNVKANEPFTFGWYFLVAGELGLIGAAALLLLLANLAVNAVQKITLNDWGGWAVLAALAGLAVSGWFTSPMVRGAGGALAFIMALAWSRIPVAEPGGGEEDG